MKYARLYRVRGQWELTIGLDFECRQVISVQTFATFNGTNWVLV